MMQHTSLHTTLPMRVFSLFLGFVLVFTLTPFPSHSMAFADEIADKQAEADIALANLNSMQAELDRLSNAYGEALMAQEEAEQQCVQAQERIDVLNQQVQDLQSRLGDRAREMYRSGSATLLDLLLGATSFLEFATNWEVLNKVNENDAFMVAERKALKEEIEEQKVLLEEQRQVATEKAEEAARAASEAEATVNQMQAIYDGLSAEVAELLEAQRQAELAAEQARQNQSNGNQSNGGQSNGGSGGSSSGYNPSDDDTPVQPSYEGGSDTVSRAYACLGAPYVWGGTGPYGYDCSGLVGYCLTGSHSRLGTTGTFINWPEVSDPQPGDVCVIHETYGSQHTGIYIGGGQMIHAATYGVGVIIGPVQAGMKIVRYPG